MNSLNKDLKFKTVIFMQEALDVPAAEHPFLVISGFGASSFTGGDALHGFFLSDGEEARMEGYMVERFATAEEVKQAEKHEEILNDKNMNIEHVLGVNENV